MKYEQSLVKEKKREANACPPDRSQGQAVFGEVTAGMQKCRPGFCADGS